MIPCRTLALPAGLFVALGLVGLVLCGSGCKRQEAAPPPTGAASPAPPSKAAAAADEGAQKKDSTKAAVLPASLDTGDLDKDELALLNQIVSDQFDPCGRSRSFLEALQAGDCALADRLARFLVRGLQQGHGKRRLVTMLLREIERLNTVVQVDTTGAPRLGPADAKVQVIAFSDFECPFCGKSAQPTKKLQAHYGVALYYKHFPLTSHKLAEGAARASWAAQQQDRFWQLHDVLFAHQNQLAWSDVKTHAAGLGIDMTRFQADTESEAARKAVARDYDHGVEAGVDGTPTFFINGRRAETVEQLQDAIREQLALAGVKDLPPVLNVAAAAPTAATPTTAKVP